MKKTTLTISTISFILFIAYMSLNDETTSSKKSIDIHTPLVLESVDDIDKVNEMEVESVEVFEKQEVNDREEVTVKSEYKLNKEVDFDSELALSDEDMEYHLYENMSSDEPISDEELLEIESTMNI